VLAPPGKPCKTPFCCRCSAVLTGRSVRGASQGAHVAQFPGASILCAAGRNEAGRAGCQWGRVLTMGMETEGMTVPTCWRRCQPAEVGDTMHITLPM